MLKYFTKSYAMILDTLFPTLQEFGEIAMEADFSFPV